MKKVKQSKKRWAWTKAQKRKCTPGRYSKWLTVPRWYRRQLHKENKAVEKRALSKLKKGYEEDEIDFGPKHQQSSAGYSWW